MLAAGKTLALCSKPGSKLAPRGQIARLRRKNTLNAALLGHPLLTTRLSPALIAVQHTPSYSMGWWTTLDLWPETGRTHQLRRHVASLGAPIVGDDLYTGEVPNIRKKGLFLYSIGIRIQHPIAGEWVEHELDEPVRYETRRRSERRRFARTPS